MQRQLKQMLQRHEKDEIKKAKKNCLKVHEIMKNHERHREKNSWIRRRTRKADHVVLERIVFF